MHRLQIYSRPHLRQVVRPYRHLDLPNASLIARHIFNIPGLSRNIHKTMTETLPQLPDIQLLSTRVLRVLGKNPSKYTLQGSNTFLVGDGRKRILIDTGEGKPIYSELLKQALQEQNATIESILLTHWHHDHTGGVQQVLDLCDEHNKPTVYKHKPEAGQTDIADGQIFRVDGATLRAFYCPGHTNDHMAFILEEEDAMFTGDNVLGHGTTVFEDLPAYMDSLDRMQKQFNGWAYPGHGQVLGDGVSKIREYITHRKQREGEVLNVLREEASGNEQGWQSMEIVKIIYRDYPEALHLPAEGGVKQVLKKLKLDGKVTELENGNWKLAEKAAL
ncbi:Metallo-hydrolase/oxidoreductase [Dissoconium aciculare CBS 342.82]|uniref:Metallo-hydrolase/oxidoreductase n=1 Tax=Dissoconium aciculare CBS 342.82 TaxID=1314786 RepID=A0A6J3M8Z7_9PEZI|nr:Metallo-hydrolase/oxidoreductase [Dissoconium aciculare CBS 342.82]KAF1824521.1 Metallo-hydrolase/oxidoreductase [Dissoconium aciculare CBS 342.82]